MVSRGKGGWEAEGRGCVSRLTRAGDTSFSHPDSAPGLVMMDSGLDDPTGAGGGGIKAVAALRSCLLCPGLVDSGVNQLGGRACRRGYLLGAFSFSGFSVGSLFEPSPAVASEYVGGHTSRPSSLAALIEVSLSRRRCSFSESRLSAVERRIGGPHRPLGRGGGASCSLRRGRLRKSFIRMEGMPCPVAFWCGIDPSLMEARTILSRRACREAWHQVVGSRVGGIHRDIYIHV